MKKCYFYESWYLVAGLLVVLEVMNVQLLSEMLPQPIPALISALLAAVLFMYLGQAFKSYREAVRDDMETWKKEQARLTDTVAMLKRDIDIMTYLIFRCHHFDQLIGDLIFIAVHEPYPLYAFNLAKLTQQLR